MQLYERAANWFLHAIWGQLNQTEAVRDFLKTLALWDSSRRQAIENQNCFQKGAGIYSNPYPSKSITLNLSRISEILSNYSSPFAILFRQTAWARFSWTSLACRLIFHLANSTRTSSLFRRCSAIKQKNLHQRRCYELSVDKDLQRSCLPFHAPKGRLNHHCYWFQWRSSSWLPCLQQCRKPECNPSRQWIQAMKRCLVQHW